MIQTKRLNLIPLQSPHFQAIIKEDYELLGKLLDVQTPKIWSEMPDAAAILPYFQAMIGQEPHVFTSYAVVHRADRQLIGTGGFKGKPNSEGMVEIGYEISKAYQGQGIATEAAHGLIHLAFSQPKILVVQAHTLAHENASVSVLKKVGMHYAGIFDDPEDGAIWRWQIARVEYFNRF
jgi:[ribosomal protein S5]-alanine N-acetyltransferase